MTAKHFIYLIFPFAVGFIAQQILNIPDTSYWFYVWLLCPVSVFIFIRFILPYHEQKFDEIKDIDIKSAFEDKTSEEKPYAYIVGFHMVAFLIIIVHFFIKL